MEEFKIENINEEEYYMVEIYSCGCSSYLTYKGDILLHNLRLNKKIYNPNRIVINGAKLPLDLI